MKVAFVIPDLNLSGGILTVLQHAIRLRSTHGIAAELVYQHPARPGWEYEQIRDVSTRSYEDALSRHYDVAVATWWGTTVPLFDVSADRYAYFVQSLEDRFYVSHDSTKLLAASLTYELPVTFLTAAQWISDTLRTLRPDVPCFYVRSGIDKETFSYPEPLDVRLERPLRILIEGRPDVWFKGVNEALAATDAMREPRHVTLVAPYAAKEASADRVLGPLNHAQLARAYRQSDVVLKLSRIEGMYAPPLEGFHCGTTTVTTPVTGHEEYVVHGWNGLVVDWDDTVGTARFLDLLSRDRRLLHFLRRNAVATARAWPNWDQSTQFMALALRRIRDRPSPRMAAGGRTLARVELQLEQSQVFRPAGGASPFGLRAAVLNHLWMKPKTARLLRIAYKPPFFRPLRWLARRLLD